MESSKGFFRGSPSQDVFGCLGSYMDGLSYWSGEG